MSKILDHDRTCSVFVPIEKLKSLQFHKKKKIIFFQHFFKISTNSYENDLFQQPAWLLDLVVKGGVARGPIPTSSNSIWIVISIDGASEPFSTNIATVSMRPVWDYPSRVILRLQDITKAYMYLTLCTYGPDQGVVALARSRICLRYFPNGTPKEFAFPLMSAYNSAEEMMSLTLFATISSLPANFQQNGGNDSLFTSQGSTFGSNFSNSAFNSGFGSNFSNDVF